MTRRAHRTPEDMAAIRAVILCFLLMAVCYAGVIWFAALSN